MRYRRVDLFLLRRQLVVPCYQSKTPAKESLQVRLGLDQVTGLQLETSHRNPV